MTLTKRDRYPFAVGTQRMCRVLKHSPERVFKRAGMPPDSLDHEGRGVTARQFFAIWNAHLMEASREDAVLYLARSTARGAMTPTTLAFSCSAKLGTGFERLSVFKPLVFPLRINIEHDSTALNISLEPVDPDVPVPDSFAAFEMFYLLALSRNCTNERIVPLSVSLPGQLANRQKVEEYLSVAVRQSGSAELRISREDAELPLISADEQMWEDFEPGLYRRLMNRDRNASISARVRRALMELLPAGHSSADAVCAHLHVSKRSLYRYLKSEGETFQSVLDATRSDLSMQYLANDEMSIDEISYLLAFRDPNSFYRAFRGWTGMTPMEARSQRLQ